jgi:hypothetical protein
MIFRVWPAGAGFDVGIGRGAGGPGRAVMGKGTPVGSLEQRRGLWGFIGGLGVGLEVVRVVPRELVRVGGGIRLEWEGIGGLRMKLGLGAVWLMWAASAGVAQTTYTWTGHVVMMRGLG